MEVVRERDVTDSFQVVITGNLVQRSCLFTEMGSEEEGVWVGEHKEGKH